MAETVPSGAGSKYRRFCLSRSWTTAEVIALQAATVEQAKRTGHLDGTGWDWHRVAVQVPSKTARQCLEKWRNCLMPGLHVHAAWTDSDDYIIAREHSRIGTHWSAMVQYIPSRSANHIKNRFNSVKRRCHNPAPPNILHIYIRMLAEAEAELPEAVGRSSPLDCSQPLSTPALQQSSLEASPDYDRGPAQLLGVEGLNVAARSQLFMEAKEELRVRLCLLDDQALPGQSGEEADADSEARGQAGMLPGMTHGPERADVHGQDQKAQPQQLGGLQELPQQLRAVLARLDRMQGQGQAGHAAELEALHRMPQASTSLAMAEQHSMAGPIGIALGLGQPGAATKQAQALAGANAVSSALAFGHKQHYSNSLRKASNCSDPHPHDMLHVPHHHSHASASSTATDTDLADDAPSSDPWVFDLDQPSSKGQKRRVGERQAGSGEPPGKRHSPTNLSHLGGGGLPPMPRARVITAVAQDSASRLECLVRASTSGLENAAPATAAAVAAQGRLLCAPSPAHHTGSQDRSSSRAALPGVSCMGAGLPQPGAFQGTAPQRLPAFVAPGSQPGGVPGEELQECIDAFLASAREAGLMGQPQSTLHPPQPQPRPQHHHHQQLQQQQHQQLPCWLLPAGMQQIMLQLSQSQGQQLALPILQQVAGLLPSSMMQLPPPSKLYQLPPSENARVPSTSSASLLSEIGQSLPPPRSRGSQRAPSPVPASQHQLLQIQGHDGLPLDMYSAPFAAGTGLALPQSLTSGGQGQGQGDGQAAPLFHLLSLLADAAEPVEGQDAQTELLEAALALVQVKQEHLPSQATVAMRVQPTLRAQSPIPKAAQGAQQQRLPMLPPVAGAFNAAPHVQVQSSSAGNADAESRQAGADEKVRATIVPEAAAVTELSTGSVLPGSELVQKIQRLSHMRAAVKAQVLQVQALQAEVLQGLLQAGAAQQLPGLMQ